MPGLVEANGPNYVSQHSADVILSDVRPFKLKADALRAINVFLDEILYNILNSSNSLVPDRLRVSLLGLLPTSLGKEALLEAEVELRAYWERTAPAGIVPSGEDDRATFHLPLAFELLRNKCEAYSTLNEAEEDPSTEGRISERFGRLGASAPKAALVAPASLYLTAILEAICEHVLSNVGRVAARDSSRTSATVNDLFTALCEDASIYGYFRTLKVYDQIEHLSKAPRSSRRSKSFTRNDRGGSISRTSTPHQDPLAGSLSRQSSESSHGHVPNNPSRSSFEKARAMRMFTNSKQSVDQESQSGHRKTTSTHSDHSRYTQLDDELDPAEDAAMLQEFDDLMRSASTMKVSLTPDRLKTMEVYKQEKVQRGNRRVAPLVLDPEPDAPSSLRPLPTASSLRHVDSIVEDDEEGSSPKQKVPRPRQPSVTTANQPSTMPPSNRSRSISTSGVQPMTRKPLRTPPANVPSAFPGRMHTLSNSASNPNIAYTRTAQASSRSPDANPGVPVRKSTRQRNRESIDLDDIMNGSDDDELDAPAPPPVPPIGKRVPKVSSTTRELMDFLAEGPPDVGPRNGPMMEYGASTASLDKPKGNRLQRMISKLNIGNEKPKAPESPVKGSHYRPVGVLQSPPGGALSPLANRPIPPRPPRPPQPISPPSSPSQVSLAEEPPKAPPPRKYPAPPPQDHYHVNSAPNNAHPPSPSMPNPQQQVSRSNSKEIPPSPKIVHHVNGNGIPKQLHSKPSIPDTQTPPLPPPGVPPPIRKPVPIPIPKPVPNPIPNDTKEAPIPTRPAESLVPAPTSIASEADLRDLQRCFANATSADECRLMFDMFLTRSGVKPTTTTAASPKGLERKAPYPSPSPSLIKQSPQIAPTLVDDITALETSVIELLLGESGSGGSGRRSPVATAAAAPTVPLSPPQPHQLQSESRSPSPPKPRRLPQVPKPEREPQASAPVNGNGNGNGNGQQVGVPQWEKEQEKSTTIPITTTNTTTWKNTAEFPTHAGTNSTLIQA